ncbi:MAG: gfo/Idh/MocA family oxidoreductase [Pirellula sp.]|nr:gfo/Idh/MocA family oxidoreductase [Pirellula sp.]
MSQRITRRRFVQSSALLAAVGPWAASRMAGAAAPASERITLGFIGMGKQARGHVGRFLGMPDVQILAVSDVEPARLADAKQTVEKGYAKQTGGSYSGCAAYADFRELLARDDIDAVVISTPDHWHAIPAIMAAHSGKDVYCEKPLSVFIAEGRAMVAAAREKNIVFQTGSQQRSEFGGKFRQAVELVRNGHIGEVQKVRVGVGEAAIPCDLPTEPVPAGTDWNMWLGYAPERGYNAILCPQGLHNHFPAWRKYREYAGGALADMGAHHFDIAQWALNKDDSGPVKIEPPADGAKTGLKFTYADGVEMFHGGPSGCTFEGTKGTLYVDRSKIESTPAGIISHKTNDSEWRCEPSDNHHRNWIEAVKARKKPICDVEIGHRSASVCELGNIGYQLKRTLKWNPQEEKFIDDAEANALVTRELRAPWKLG